MSQETTTSAASCAQCGAAVVDGMTCLEQLGAIIAWELEDPDLQAEHFLTVACYNLQHPAQFTDQALADLRVALIDRLERGIAVEELRRRAAQRYAGHTRVLKDEAERRPVLRTWSVTIADVCGPGPQGAAGRVRAWAAAVRR